MIKDYKPSEYIEEKHKVVVFDSGYPEYAGFMFHKDKDGNVRLDNDAQRENYQHCLEHPEKFTRFNKEIEMTDRYHTAPAGTCKCGAHIELHDQYHGSCSCPKCGQWYNLFGQELLPPVDWGDTDED